MTSFKTKRITRIPSEGYFQTQKENSTTPNLSEKQGKKTTKNKWFRRLVGGLLILSSLTFIGIIGAKAIMNTNAGKNLLEAEIFQPITHLIEGEHSHETQTENKKGSKNILLAGIGGKGHPGGELTDSLMLVNLNYDSKTVTLLSIPRDIFVAYPKNGAGKLNSLYPLGQQQGEGINILAKKISEMTGQPIHHYAVIDFSGFKAIVNALGGVEVDVPKNIYDREYPNESWGWEVFSLKKGLQTLDGATALKFARSRHSTSDFDRSSRQQLLLKAIKDKALSLGILTNPTKISNLIDSVRNHLSTDLKIGDIVEIGLEFKDIDNKHIVMYSFNNECESSECLPGAFLYQPSMEVFQTWTIIPEGATSYRLSKYDAMRRYAGLIFTYPHLKDQEKVITIVTQRKNQRVARLIRKGLEQLGFPIDHKSAIVQTNEKLNNSKIIAYYNEATQEGFNEEHILIKAIKYIDKDIPIIFTPENTFTKEKGPQIEIIIGDDYKNFFSFTPNSEYLPQYTPPKKNSSPDGNNTKTKSVTQSGSTEKANNKNSKNDTLNQKNENKKEKTPQNDTIFGSKTEESTSSKTP